MTHATIRLLILEDLKEHILLINDLLLDDSEHTYTVTGVHTLAAAKEMLGEQEFDIILVDLGLPDSQGLDTAKAIIEYCPTVPLLVITCDDSFEHATGALRMGFEDYILKESLSKAILSESIQRAIKHHAEMRSQPSVNAEPTSDVVTFPNESQPELKVEVVEPTPALDEEALNTNEQCLRQIQHTVNHDELTSLANRLQFENQMSKAWGNSLRHNTMFAVIILDLDNFYQVNDHYGREHGDAIIKKAAIKIQESLREGDVVARLRSDEFAILLNPIRDKEIPGLVAQSILQNINHPASIGIACYPQADAANSQMLMKRADIALIRVKQSGKNNYQYYNKDELRFNRARMQIESCLPTAIQNDELYLVYQPMLDINDLNRVVGAEALLRWRHPHLGDLMREMFIPIADEMDMMRSIGQWVMEELCRQQERWSKTFRQPIAINLSPHQLAKDPIVDDIQKVLSRHNLPTSTFQVEIPEFAFDCADKMVQNKLERLANIGINIVVDNLGRGEDTLACLHNALVKRVKLDRSIITDILNQSERRMMVKSALAIAKDLGIETVACGVESMDQAKCLADYGCDYVQGYYFLRPVMVRDFEKFLEENKAQVNGVEFKPQDIDYIAELCQYVRRLGHDMNNVLASIQGYVELIKLNLKLESASLFDDISKNVSFGIERLVELSNFVKNVEMTEGDNSHKTKKVENFSASFSTKFNTVIEQFPAQLNELDEMCGDDKKLRSMYNNVEKLIERSQGICNRLSRVAENFESSKS